MKKRYVIIYSVIHYLILRFYIFFCTSMIFGESPDPGMLTTLEACIGSIIHIVVFLVFEFAMAKKTKKLPKVVGILLLIFDVYMCLVLTSITLIVVADSSFSIGFLCTYLLLFTLLPVAAICTSIFIRKKQTRSAQ